jgi:hypothetical protein
MATLSAIPRRFAPLAAQHVAKYGEHDEAEAGGDRDLRREVHPTFIVLLG